jgi:hypothetical protein
LLGKQDPCAMLGKHSTTEPYPRPTIWIYKDNPRPPDLFICKL